MADLLIEKFADPITIYRRVRLEDDQNALLPWCEAAAGIVDLDELNTLINCLQECDCGQTDCVSCHPLQPDELNERAARLLEKNGIALRLIDEGLRRGTLQLPVRGPNSGDFQTDTLQNMRALARLKFLRAHLFTADFDYLSAARTTIDVLRLGEICCKGEGLIVDFIVGMALQRAALEDLSKLTRHEGVERDTLAEMRDALDHVVRPDSLVEVLRVEFCCWSVPVIELIAPEQPLEKLVDRLLELFYQQRPLIADLPEDWAPDDRLDWRRRQILNLLKDHPSPWDQSDTLRAIARNAAEIIEQITGQPARMNVVDDEAQEWNQRRERFQQYWPNQLSPWCPYEALGRSASAKAFRKEMADAAGPELATKIYGCVKLPSSTELRNARRQILGINNLLGLLVYDQAVPTNVASFLENLNARVAILRDILGERLPTPNC